MPFSLVNSLARIFIARRFVRLARKGCSFIDTPEAARTFLDSCSPSERASYTVRDVYMTQLAFERQQPHEAPAREHVMIEPPFEGRRIEVREREAA